MRIITLNLNGIRAAVRKGFFDWVKTQNADVICVQELKAQQNEMQSLTLENYYGYFHFAEKKGYSGVGIFTRHEPANVVTGLGWSSADQEGRYVAINLKHVWIASVYLPSGTSGEHRQVIKYDFLEKYENYLRSLQVDPATAVPAVLARWGDPRGENRDSPLLVQAQARLARSIETYKAFSRFSAGTPDPAIKNEYILCGDFNIAHKNIDLKNWKGNQKNSGFLPAERAWLDKLFGEMGFVDAFRIVNQEADQYTWWSHRGQAWTKNVGWRIDYQIITPGLKLTVKSAKIYKEQRFSDHAPLIMDYDIIL